MAAEPPICSIPSDARKSRFSALRDQFVSKYGCPPSFYARAPGRVNLIGEHIDYCGYAVLPMAIEQDILIAATSTDAGALRLANTNNRFSDYQCKTNNIVIDKTQPRWFHYFLCGLRGIQDHCTLTESRGIDLLLDGTVPCSAGLSSSSALVCCAALTTAKANAKTLSKVTFAEVSQHAERHIGTEGGGMDQAISILAEAGKAMLIEFNPLRPHEVTLPAGAVFVISNSCVEINKAATAHYNTRVAECRLATQVLAKSKGLDGSSLKKLGDVQAALAVKLDDMVTLVSETFHKAPYSKAEIAELLGITTAQLETNFLSERTKNLDSFKLHDRASHVYSEAARVWSFKRICDEAPSDALKQLGDLMNASHHSTSVLYECSCEELDELTKICRESGALGSRLTGAGWGGCAVSLVPADLVPTFIASVTERYYNQTPQRQARLHESLFATNPGNGACYYQGEA